MIPLFHSHHVVFCGAFLLFCISRSQGSKILVSQLIDSDEALDKHLATKQSSCFAHLEIISEALDWYSISKLLQDYEELCDDWMRNKTTTISSVMEIFVFFHAEILDTIVNGMSDAEDSLKVITGGWIGTKVVTLYTQSGSVLIIGLAFFLWSDAAIDSSSNCPCWRQFASMAQAKQCSGNPVLLLILHCFGKRSN